MRYSVAFIYIAVNFLLKYPIVIMYDSKKCKKILIFSICFISKQNSNCC